MNITPGGNPVCTECKKTHLQGPPHEPVLGVLTGQVPVWPGCHSHKEVAHEADGSRKYCNRCGWNRTEGVKMGTGSGGWGTP